MTAALLAALLLQATPETLADLERAFDQTCNGRIYGQFDDMCSALEAQVKSYRAELRRQPRKAPPPARSRAPAQTSAATTSPALEPRATDAPKG